MRTQVWSSGGGTQSAAIAALICKGELRPDLAVISDTEREVSQTWEYHDSIIVPNLAIVGVTLHRVPKSKYATVDLYGGKDGESLLIPAFQNITGKQGKLPAFCSNECIWLEPIERKYGWVGCLGGLYEPTYRIPLSPPSGGEAVSGSKTSSPGRE